MKKIFLLCLLMSIGLMIPRYCQAASPGDLVINEVAWMGTTISTSDEWIELYNPTGATIDLSGWTIKASDLTPSINLLGTIAAGGYFLLERTDDDSVSTVAADQIYSGALENGGEELVLRDNADAIIDQLNAIWDGGDNTAKATMERKDPAGSGTDAINFGNATAAYTGGLGTPKAQNSIFSAGGADPGSVSVYFSDPLAGLPQMTSWVLQEGDLTNAVTIALDAAQSSIDAALYHLSWQPVIDSLIAAHNRGITVRIAAMDDSLSDTGFQQLQAAGVIVNGVTTSNIMHNKFYIIDGSVVFTGSWNPTTTGSVYNANDGVKLDSFIIAAAYQKKFDNLFQNRYGKNNNKGAHNADITASNAVTVGNTQVEVYFQPRSSTVEATEPGGYTRFLELIDSTQSSLYISIFFMTDDEIYNRVVLARDRGVAVKSVFDYRAWRNTYSEADDAIDWGGGVVDANPGVYHHKFAVFDGEVVWTGSTNFSAAGFQDNEENSLVLHSVPIATNYIARTDSFFDDATNYDNVSNTNQAPRIVTRHFSGWAESNFISWRTMLDKNIPIDHNNKMHLLWRYNSITSQYEFLQAVNWAVGFYSDSAILQDTVYYYCLSALTQAGNHSPCSAEFAQMQNGADGTNTQPNIDPLLSQNRLATFSELINPQVSITNPPPASVVSGYVDISFEAVDISYVKSYEIWIDGFQVASNNLFNWNTTQETAGSHSIRVKAIDVFGNSGEYSSTVTVDNSIYVSPPAVDYTNIKVLSYNIAESGKDLTYDYKQVLKEENADILLLVETGDFDDLGNRDLNNLVVELNNYFGNSEYPYLAAQTEGQGSKYTGLAVLSRFDISTAQLIPVITLDDGKRFDVSHDFLDVNLQVGSESLHVIGVHLKASSGTSNETKRELAQEGIINYMDGLGGGTHIIYMGDLNSFHPDDTLNNGDLGTGPIDMLVNSANSFYSVMHTFSDAYRLLFPDPTISPGYTFLQAPYESRIDFLFLNSYLSSKVNLFTVGDTAGAISGSDHMSVDATLDLSDWSVIPPPPPPVSNILIAEVFYDTPGNDGKEEWIELYNSGSSVMDLTGWQIKDNNGTYTLGSVTVAASGYLVVARDNQGFQALYGFNPDISGLSTSLSNSGDKVQLLDDLGVEIDYVAWEGYAPGWTISAPTGSSIRRTTVGLDTDSDSDFEVIANNGTPGSF